MCTTYNLRKEWVKVPHLFWNLSWNLISSHGVLIRLFPESKVKASEGERERDTTPHADKDEHGGEGNRS